LGVQTLVSSVVGVTWEKETSHETEAAAIPSEAEANLTCVRVLCARRLVGGCGGGGCGGGGGWWWWLWWWVLIVMTEPCEGKGQF
jgi:hypothetical protein